MSSMSHALEKRKSSEETQITESQMTMVELFDGPKAKTRFENNFKECHGAPTREINLEFFYKEGFRCFQMFKFNGCSGVYHFDPRKESGAEQKFSERGTTGSKPWHLYLRVILPHIIVSHMKHICQSSYELAYRMVITRIAKYIKADLNEYEGGGEAIFQSRFDIGLLHHMQFRKIGKHWVKKGKELEIVPKIEEVPELPKGRKRKTVGKGKVKKEETSSHTEKEAPLSEETVPKAQEKYSPLNPMNYNTLFRLLQETLCSSNFNHDSQVSHNKLLKEIIDSINATNGLLTSIQFLLQKQITMASITAAAKGLVPPLRPKPQIKDVD
ncbi:uncharacterized protein G2W53_041814 [Senna tora]|uniref:Uncharacterized protein n=1 Tax=Senna tora TaxID=362788 RepID=A0A834SFE7_9FABA|nr:uncharacterized protein G2W53_041814 [Senna tora]